MKTKSKYVEIVWVGKESKFFMFQIITSSLLESQLNEIPFNFGTQLEKLYGGVLHFREVTRGGKPI